MKMMNGCVLLALVFALAFLTESGWSQEDEQQDGGFFGNILIGGGISSGNPSQLEVTNDNKTVDSPGGRAAWQSRTIPLIVGELGYEISSTGTRISVGNKRGDTVAGALVVEQSLGKLGLLQTILGYGREDVWADPYQVGIRRRKTDELSLGLEVELTKIAGTGAMVALRGSRIDVDDDRIGDRYADLRRDGDVVAAGIGYSIPLAENHVIIPCFELEVEDRDGASNSSMQTEFALIHQMHTGSWSFETALVYSMRKFDKVHPIFHQTREEKNLAATELITYGEPFGWQGFFIHGLISYTYTDANIEFFDSDILLVGAGIGYSF